MIDDGIDDYETSDNFTKAEKIAIRYSELMDTAPEKIDSTFYSELSEHYSNEEIIELGVYIAFNVGYHRFFGTLDFFPMFAPDGTLVDQEKSREIYGDSPVSQLQSSTRQENLTKAAE